MIFECERNLISRTLAFERPDFGAGRGHYLDQSSHEFERAFPRRIHSLAVITAGLLQKVITFCGFILKRAAGHYRKFDDKRKAET